MKNMKLERLGFEDLEQNLINSWKTGISVEMLLLPLFLVVFLLKYASKQAKRLLTALENN